MKKKSEWNNVLRFLVTVGSAVVALASIYVSYYIKFKGAIPQHNLQAFEHSYLWILLGFIVIHVLLGTYVFYNKRLIDLLYNTLIGQLFWTFFMMALSYAGGWTSFPRTVFALNYFISTLFVFGYSAIVYRFYQRIRGSKSIMVVGEEQRVLEAVQNFATMNNKRHKVTHVVLSNYLYQIKRLINEVDIVYLAGHIAEQERLAIYEYLMNHNKKLFISTNFENLMMVNPNVMNFEDESIIEVSTFEIPEEQAFFKRLIDIVVSVVMLVLTLPIMLITAIAIKIDSPGPVFYKQERVTLGNRPFEILKFRSMAETAEDESGPVLATSNDARVTKVGRIIRSTRIDELPQLINVLKGDMSLVGPRPERPFFVKQFASKNSHYPLRHHVRAGITGYAQVYGKYTTDFNSKLNFDLLYIKDYSLAFDFKLLFQTIKILFDKISARGVDDVPDRPNEWSAYESKMKIYR